MKKKSWYPSPYENRIDSADEISGYYTAQAFIEAQGRFAGGNLPLIDEERYREAKALADRREL